MRVVTRFESDLLRIVQCIVGHLPVHQVVNTLKTPRDLPALLSRDAVQLVQQMLATGLVRSMVELGAWRSERFLRDGQGVCGPLWERSPPDRLGLRFSAESLDLLMWLAKSDGSAGMPAWRASSKGANNFTIADRLLQYRIAVATAETGLLADWYRFEPWTSNPLIGLSLPHPFALANHDPSTDFDAWMIEPGSLIIEALQSELAEHLIRNVKAKAHLVHATEITRLGHCEDAVFSAFLNAARDHNRPDLCRFLLLAAQRLLSESSSVRHWVFSLDTSSLKMDERAAAYRAAAAFPRAIAAFSQWHRHGESIRFFDDGYSESQFLKEMWEEFDAEALVRHTDRMLAELNF